jgi:hypothetical protein
MTTSTPLPTITQRVLDIAKMWLNDTFVAKNSDYGASYILTGKTIQLWFPDGFSLNSPVKHAYLGLLTRMLDKLIRTSNLILRGREGLVEDEKAYVTMGDLGVYGFMTAELLKNGIDGSKYNEKTSD